MPTVTDSYLVRPRSAANGYDPRDVAKAYNYPTQYTGKGRTCAIIELGGGFGQADLQQYFGSRGLNTPKVVSVPVAGGQNNSDGPNGADGEVLLDIEVAASVAPDATFRIYFAPNTDAGFLKAVEQAVTDRVDVISISWGGPENNWSASSMNQFDAVFKQAKDFGILTFVAAGDNGSGDGESGKHVDFPASSPNVIGCGGTRLEVDSSGARSSETVWNDSTSSATGGGVSIQFPGRDVPDVAGNADPVTGYDVLVDGQEAVIGGTSAVAPLYAGLALLLSEALGAPVGSKVDFIGTITANPGVCFDVTAGSNGAFRAGPGRDETTGFGVVDGSKFLEAITSTSPAPVPTPTPTPSPVPTPTPTPAPNPDPASGEVQELLDMFKRFVTRFENWLNNHGL